MTKSSITLTIPSYTEYDEMTHEEIMDSIIIEFQMKGTEEVSPEQVIRTLRARGCKWTGLEREVRSYLN